MPEIEVVFYCDDDGSVPVLDWLRDVSLRDIRVRAKCFIRIQLPASLGHELRRPLADTLQDGIYELRIRFQSVQYRILYFFDGRTAAVLATGTVKEGTVPAKEIQVAAERRSKYLENRVGHPFRIDAEAWNEAKDE